MLVKELWRYPVKSMAGERVTQIEVGPLGLAGDRTVLVRRKGKVVTARTDPRLLGLKGTLSDDGVPRISGHAWDFGFLGYQSIDAAVCLSRAADSIQYVVRRLRLLETAACSFVQSASGCSEGRRWLSVIFEVCF
jgi:hypothetical protein